MKNSQRNQTPDNNISRLSLTELRQKWAEFWGMQPHSSISRGILYHRVVEALRLARWRIFQVLVVSAIVPVTNRKFLLSRWSSMLIGSSKRNAHGILGTIVSTLFLKLQVSKRRVPNYKNFL